MKFLGLRLSVCWLVLALSGSLGLTACGYGHGGGSYSSINGYMTGQWDFTVTNAKGRVPFVIEANLNQDKHGNLSAPGSVTANGPTGNVSSVFLVGGSLSGTSVIYLDYLGFTCNGSDTGDRSITGTINSSNQVTLTLAVGGSEVDTITGTMNNSATPPSPAFTGTLTSSGACGGPGIATVTGQFPVTIYSGTYSGTSAADSTETISLNLTLGTSGSLTGSGTDSKLGNFTLTGNAVGNAFSATLSYASSPANSGPVFGYFDRQLGPTGSILLVSFQGANATSCPVGVGPYNGTCEIATLALP
jgi:hypothetical protein